MEPVTVSLDGFKQTEIGLIPEGWEVATIGDVVTIKGGGTPSTTVERYWNGHIPWLIPSDVTALGRTHTNATSRYITKEGLKNSSANLCPPGTVMMTSRATIGEVVINDVPMATNQGFICIRCDPERLYNDYLLYQIKHRKPEIVSLGHGVTFKEVTKTNFKRFQILLPSLPEQRAIAHALSTLQSAAEAQAAIAERARELKRALMTKLFTEGLRGEALKETEIGVMPEGWEVKEVSRLGEIVTGTTPPTKIPEYYGSQYQFISPADLGKTKYVYSTEKHLSAAGLSVARELPRDTVLVTCIGSTTGKVGMTYTDRSATNQQINALIPHSGINSHYLYYLFDFKSDYIRSLSTPSPVPILSKGKFGKAILPFACDRAEREHTATVLSAVDTKIEFADRKRARLEELFRATLGELMTGRVRVAGQRMGSG